MAAGSPTSAEDAALSLTLAVVSAANSPLLLLDGDLKVVGVSAAFRQAFSLDPRRGLGQPVFALGAGEWDQPELRSLLEQGAGGEVAADTEFDLRRPDKQARQLIVHAERLEYLDLDQVRLLMAVTDATAARAADKRAKELREHNAILVREAKHRVANSLQIIASVLLQHARRTQSDEIRYHLQSAHQRVMSVAALERQLAGSGDEHVSVKPYLAALCESIRASMIPDGERVSLKVEADEGVVDANTSVSLGLITTELVINAVKYAFPQGQTGGILVSYRTDGTGWTLAVKDNGVGLPAAASVTPGLGTGIVQALAAQLKAQVVYDRGSANGTSVSVVHPAVSGRA